MRTWRCDKLECRVYLNVRTDLEDRGVELFHAQELSGMLLGQEARLETYCVLAELTVVDNGLGELDALSFHGQAPFGCVPPAQGDDAL